MTWGNEEAGGDSSAVQHRLINVEKIAASEGAFAAILGNGRDPGTAEVGSVRGMLVSLI